MIKAYKLKVYANKRKTKELNKLLAYWRDQVNHKIKIFWEFPEVKGLYPPKAFGRGNHLIGRSTIKAWQIVKGVKKKKQREKPYFKGDEIDLNKGTVHIIPGFKTKEFDLWFSVRSLQNYCRLKIPCKKTEIFNKALEKGELRKSFKLQRIHGDYYMVAFVKFPEIKKENKKVLGIDVGLKNPIVTSDGKFLGGELKDLRIRTKWRRYKRKPSPYKQGLNHYAKELMDFYPDTDFAVENLLLKGKKGRIKRFRRRNKNWAYNHLTKKLELEAPLEGFQVIRVNPANTSVECPRCGFILEANRRGESFKCKQCGFSGHSDHIAAINLAERVAKEHSSLQPIF